MRGDSGSKIELGSKGTETALERQDDQSGAVSGDSVRIVVPWDVQRTSPNQRLHWAARARENAQAKETARWAWALGGYRTLTPPVKVKIIIRRGRLLDFDNALAGCKALIDGLFCGAVTIDDGPKSVRISGVEQQSGKQWRLRPEVEFIIEADLP